MNEEALYENHDQHCAEILTDVWSCMCIDRCPNCNKEIEPSLSMELII